MDSEERLLDTADQPSDRKQINLRPTYFDDYLGQETAKENLKVFVEAAKKRNEALDHVLLHGPPGLGKTTLANIISNAMGVHCKVTSGPAIEKAGDLAALLTNLEPHDVLFIDEIHRLSSAVEEVLYPAMEDFQLDILIGQGPSARTVRLDLPPFTLIGATTKAGTLTNPLRDRFGIVIRLEYYAANVLSEILMRNATLLDTAISEDGADEIARRSRGTPRIANRLLKRVRDFAQVGGEGSIDHDFADTALERLEVDRQGFDEMDRQLLEAIIKKYDGGPVGLETLAITVGEDKNSLEEIYESYLVYRGYIQRTPRGRIATHLAYEHLGLALKSED